MPESSDGYTDYELEQLAKRYVHQKISSVIAKCGHKVTLNWAPANHCDECWDTWFAAHSEEVYPLFKRVTDGETEGIKHERGAKFLKQFMRFIARVQERGRQKQLQEAVA